MLVQKETKTKTNKQTPHLGNAYQVPDAIVSVLNIVTYLLITTPRGVGAIIVLISQVSELRHREDTYLPKVT